MADYDGRLTRREGVIELPNSLPGEVCLTIILQFDQSVMTLFRKEGRALDIGFLWGVRKKGSKINFQ
jgi:hypothetical protein